MLNNQILLFICFGRMNAWNIRRLLSSKQCIVPMPQSRTYWASHRANTAWTAGTITKDGRVEPDGKINRARKREPAAYTWECVYIMRSQYMDCKKLPTSFCPSEIDRMTLHDFGSAKQDILQTLCWQDIFQSMNRSQGGYNIRWGLPGDEAAGDGGGEVDDAKKEEDQPCDHLERVKGPRPAIGPTGWLKLHAVIGAGFCISLWGRRGTHLKKRRIEGSPSAMYNITEIGDKGISRSVHTECLMIKAIGWMIRDENQDYDDSGEIQPCLAAWNIGWMEISIRWCEGWILWG